MAVEAGSPGGAVPRKEAAADLNGVDSVNSSYTGWNYVQDWLKEHMNSPEYQDSAMPENRDDLVPPTDAKDPYYGEPSTPQLPVYIDAPYAELYGMDAGTAYQEALANTAYQRKVKDLKAAGLNPVLGYSGAGAASFYGNEAGSSGGISAGSSGSAKSSLSVDWDQVIPGLVSTAVDLALFFSNPLGGAAKAGAKAAAKAGAKTLARNGRYLQSAGRNLGRTITGFIK